MNLMILGTLAFDSVETPVCKKERIIGGSSSFASIVASYFLSKVNVCAAIGYDFPENVIKAFNDRGIDTTGVQVNTGEKSFFWSGRYHKNMNDRDTLVTELNALASFDPVIPDKYRDCRFLMLGNLTPQIQKQVIDRLNNRPEFIVMDTMNYWIDKERAALDTVLEMVDAICLNEEEAIQLSEEYNIIKAVSIIKSMGPKYVIIKRGQYGALISGRGEDIFFVPAFPVKNIVDPTGAGDSFLAGFLGYLSAHNDLSFPSMKTALVYATIMASFCIEDFGIEGLMNLNKDRINERYILFTSLIRI